MLTAEDKQEALQIARGTLQTYLLDGQIPNSPPKSKKLEQNQGVFCSLHQGEALRGCIGVFDSADPLYKTIQNMAIAAATRDPRFPSIDVRELPGIVIELSVLSPRREIGHLKEIEVGRHGLVISRGSLRGVLLPQVAIEAGWDREEFLTHTCLKAGLPPGAWEEGNTVIEVFEAEVFGEKK